MTTDYITLGDRLFAVAKLSHNINSWYTYDVLTGRYCGAFNSSWKLIFFDEREDCESKATLEAKREFYNFFIAMGYEVYED